jgi:hypothetical protein
MKLQLSLSFDLAWPSEVEPPLQEDQPLGVLEPLMEEQPFKVEQPYFQLVSFMEHLRMV